MKLATPSLLIAVGGLAVLLGAGMFLWAWRAEPPARAEAASNAAVPIGGPFQLVDGNGKTVTGETFRGKLIVVFFGYTHCRTSVRPRSTRWPGLSRRSAGWPIAWR